MLLMEYPSIRGEEFSYYAKKAIWNLLYEYIDTYSQRLIDEYPGYGLQAIKRLQYQCKNTTFSEKIIYNRMFQQVIHKWGESEINYIKRFQNNKALGISVGNSYSEDQLMYTILHNFQQGGRWSAQIDIHQTQLRR